MVYDAATSSDAKEESNSSESKENESDKAILPTPPQGPTPPAENTPPESAPPAAKMDSESKVSENSELTKKVIDFLNQPKENQEPSLAERIKQAANVDLDANTNTTTEQTIFNLLNQSRGNGEPIVFEQFKQAVGVETSSTNPVTNESVFDFLKQATSESGSSIFEQLKQTIGSESAAFDSTTSPQTIFDYLNQAATPEKPSVVEQFKQAFGLGGENSSQPASVFETFKQTFSETQGAHSQEPYVSTPTASQAEPTQTSHEQPSAEKTAEPASAYETFKKAFSQAESPKAEPTRADTQAAEASRTNLNFEQQFSDRSAFERGSIPTVFDFFNNAQQQSSSFFGQSSTFSNLQSHIYNHFEPFNSGFSFNKSSFSPFSSFNTSFSYSPFDNGLSYNSWDSQNGYTFFDTGPSEFQKQMALRSAISEVSCGFLGGSAMQVYEATKRNLGYPSGFSYLEFTQLVNSTNLSSSYNLSHCTIGELQTLANLSREIGGVATKVGVIKGLKNSPEEIIIQQAIIALKLQDGAVPFSSSELRQLIRELARGIYVHQTYPFFSLHFNNDKLLYPVIHPAYNNTEVGTVIAYLDLCLKGFLNGGVYDLAFLEKWHETLNQDKEYLKSHLIDVKQKAKEAGLPYYSVRELMYRHGLEHYTGETPNSQVNSAYGDKFRNSFRIIAHSGDIKRRGHAFEVSGDFNVEYTIEMRPDLAEAVKKEQQEKGEAASDHKKLETVYRQMAHLVKNVMPQLPIFKPYFQKLEMITFLCYYLTTLKEMGQQLDIANAQPASNRVVPPVFPPLPVRYYQFYPLKLTISSLVDLLGEKGSSRRQTFDEYSFALANHQDPAFPQTIKADIIAHLHAQVPDDVQLEQGYLDLIVKKLHVNLKHLLQMRVIGFEKNLVEQIDEQSDFKTPKFAGATDDIRLLKDKAQRWREIFAAKKANAIKALDSELAKEKTKIIEKQVTDIKKAKAQNKAHIEELKKDLNKQKEEAIKDVTRQINKLITDLESEACQYGIPLEHPEIISHKENYRSQQQKAVDGINAQVNEKIKKLNETLEETNKSNDDRLKEITAEIERNITKSRAEEIKRFNEIEKNIHEAINKFLNQIAHSSDDLLDIVSDKSVNFASLYQHSHLDIADAGYYKDMGDNFNIVGGTGFDLSEVRPLSMPASEHRALVEGVKSLPYETFKVTELEGKRLASFKLGIKFEPLINASQKAAIAQTLTQKKPTVEMGDAEDKALVALKSQRSEKDIKTILSQCNLKASTENGQTMGHRLASAGLSAAIKEVHALSPEALSTADLQGYTPLHIAAKYGYVEVIKALAACQPEVMGAKTKSGMNALMIASMYGKTEAVNALLTLGASANVVLPNGLNALFLCLQAGFQETALVLIEKAADLNINLLDDSHNSALHIAIELKFIDVANKLIAKGANGNVKRKSDGFTPFHSAATLGDTSILNAMLDKGVDSTVSLDSRKTALHMVCEAGHYKAAKLLCNRAPSLVGRANDDGQTPLMFALINHHEATAKVLIDAIKTLELNINVQDKQGRTAMHYAAMHQLAASFEWLWENGADISVKDNQDLDVAYFLIITGNYANYGYFYEQEQIKVDACYQGESSLALALQHGHRVLADFILEEGGTYQSSLFPHHLPIHFAVQSDDGAYLKSWIAEKSNVDKRLASATFKKGEEKEKSLIYLAIEHNSIQCLSYLFSICSKKHLQAINKEKPLLKALQYIHDREVIELVLRHTDEPNMVLDAEGHTLAHLAVLVGNKALIKQLPDFGVQLTKKNNQGYTPFHLAILNDDERLLKTLTKLTDKKDYPQGLLNFATEHNQSECIRYLSEQNIDKSITSIRQEGFHDDCKQGKLHQVQQFIARNHADKTSFLPIMNALSQGHTLVAIELIKQGFKLGAHDSDNAFTLAFKYHNLEVMAYLLTHEIVSYTNPKAPIFIHPEARLSLKKQTKNPYLVASLEGDFTAFADDKQQLIHALENANIFELRQIIKKGFPIDTTLFEFNGVKKPYLHGVMAHEFEAAVELLKDKVNPFRTAEDGETLVSSMLYIHAQAPSQTLKWLKRYFPKDHMALLQQTEDDAQALTMLTKAMFIGNTVLINDFLEAGFPVTARSEETSIFHQAAQYGVLAVVKEALQQNVDINTQDKQGRSALMMAANGGQVGMVYFLINQGAKIHITDRLGNTALHHALNRRQQEVALYLLENGALSHKPNRKGQTPMHFAASEGMERALKAILQSSDCDVTICDNKGLDALAYATNHPSALKLLLNSSKPFTKHSIQTALKRASLLGQTKSVETLVKWGGDLLEKLDEDTPLIALAIGHGRDQMVRMLRKTLAFFAYEAQTPMLITAARNNRLYAIRELLLNAVDINAQDSRGISPLAAACMGDAVEACALLLQEGAKVDVAAIEGSTPLHFAALAGSNGCVRLLLQYGARRDSRNMNGQIPLEIAKSRNATGIIQLLGQEKAQKTMQTMLTPERPASNVSFVIETLAPLVINASNQTKLKSIMRTITNRARELAVLGLNYLKPEAQSSWVNLWVECLSRLDKKPLQKLEQALLSNYPWHVFATERFFNALENILKAPKPVQTLFWKYLTPKTVVVLTSDKFDEILTNFESFIACFEKAYLGQDSIPYKVLDNISTEVSFSLDGGAYFERMQYALTNAKEKALQASYLNHLPSLDEMASLFEDGLLFICPLVLQPAKSFYEYRLQLSCYQKIEDVTVSHFQLALLEQAQHPEHRLTPAERGILGEFFRFVLLEGTVFEQSQQAKSVVFYAHQIKQRLGFSVFRELFDLHYVESNKKYNPIEYFIKVAQAMLDLEGEIDLISLLQAFDEKELILPDVYGKLEAAQQEVFMKRFPEKPLEDVVSAFKTQAGFVQVLLKDAEIDQIQAVFPLLESLQTKFINASAQELQAEIRIHAQAVKSSPGHLEARARLFGLLAVAMQQFSGKKPYRTQLFALLALTEVEEGLKGRMGQILTGEGKSLILALLTAFYAVQGEFVDVITSSANLARRDQKEYKGFFERLNITSSHISPQETRSLTKEDFDGQVLYGTNTDFEFALLREMLYGEDVRYTQVEGTWRKRFCERVIVDEADNLFLDTARNAARLALPAPRDISFIYQPLFTFVKDSPSISTAALKERLLKECDPKQRKIVKTFTDADFARWKTSVKTALERVEGKDYIIKSGKVVIVDYNNTGRLNEGSRWSNGIHEFIECKHGLAPKTESLTAASMSHPAFFAEYKAIVGVTGTMGSSDERVEVESIYRVSTFDVPPHKTCQRMQKPTSIVTTKEEQFTALLKESESAQKQGQAVLILFETINESVEFSKYLTARNHVHHVLNASQQEDEDYLVALAGKPGKLTIATNTAGRGVDIRLMKETLAAGGLHVMFAFFPQNTRVLAQGFGRAGRQGQPGTCQLVLYKHSPSLKALLPDFVLYTAPEEVLEALINKAREERTYALSKERIKTTPVITAQYQMLKAFCERLNTCNQLLANIKYSDFDKALSLAPKFVQNATDLKDNKLAKGPLSLLKQTLKSGSKSDKQYLLSCLKTFYSQYLGQMWAEFFTNLDRNHQNTKDIKSYTSNLQDEFDAFMKGPIARYMTEDESGFYTLLGEMIKEVSPQQSQSLKRFGLLNASASSKAPEVRESKPAVDLGL